MSQFADFRGRGIQEADVFAAADALLAEAKRPTIERVRLKIGRGSPNTVSPMLERWFATLGERLVGFSSHRPAGNDPDGMPVGIRNAAKLLWETARREAEEVQRGELASALSELQAGEETLAEAQAMLAQREEAFTQARVSLDAALASSQQARETLERQLREHAIEAQRVRAGLEDEIGRLTALLSRAAETQERMAASKRKQNQTALDNLALYLAVVPWPQEAAQHYAEIRLDLKKRGAQLGAADLMIAAHARAMDAIMVTNNTKDFSRVKGLQVENWTK
ncbi:DNA-binding protein [Variovorax paradoxus]|nr:DNA-binding protein [Variovorax paradoxus]